MSMQHSARAQVPFSVVVWQRAHEALLLALSKSDAAFHPRSKALFEQLPRAVLRRPVRPGSWRRTVTNLSPLPSPLFWWFDIPPPRLQHSFDVLDCPLGPAAARRGLRAPRGCVVSGGRHVGDRGAGVRARPARPRAADPGGA